MKQYPHVFDPIRVGGVILKNRIISAPTTIHTTSSGQPYPTEESLRYFEQRAISGAGLVTCAGVQIGGAVGDGQHCRWDVTVWNHLNRLADMAERIHRHGARCTMELLGIFPNGRTVSDGCSIMGRENSGKEITIPEMEQFKRDCINTAVQVQKAGFDGVLLHTGHSVPLGQFLSPATNRRTDQYGGSTENRCRYAVEILDGIREACGPDFLLDVRISGDEVAPGAIDLDEGLRIAEILQGHCNILQASCGMHNPQLMTHVHPCGFLPPVPNVYIAEHWKRSGRIGKCLVSTIGGIHTLEECEAILAAGKADFVVVARGFIADPEWMHKGLQGRSEDVVPCIACMRCHDSDNYAHHMQCAVNPRCGLEAVAEQIPPAKEQKRVAVIGGGPAGMRAALEAAWRGHQVTLFEQQGQLGGLLQYADYVSFKWPLARYKDWLIAQLRKTAVEVRLNTQASAEDVDGYDAVIAAVGSVPVVSRGLAGVELAKTAVSVYGHEDTLGREVVIIGGGQVGLETAVHLQRKGCRVTLIEQLPQLAGDASRTHRDELLAELEKHRDTIQVRTETQCAAIGQGYVTCRKGAESFTINCDSVLLAVGLRACRQEADSFMHSAGTFCEIGDCVRARTVEWCTKEAFYAAINL